MSPDEFKFEWEAQGGTLVRYSKEALASARLPPETTEFLLSVGWPSVAHPCLEFNPSNEGWPGVTKGELFFLGNDGFGNSLGISPEGRVVLLDHDNVFRPVHVNKDVQTFAESLLRFADMLAEIDEVAGPDAILEDNVPRTLAEKFLSFLAENDPQALEPDAFWRAETCFVQADEAR